MKDKINLTNNHHYCNLMNTPLKITNLHSNKKELESSTDEKIVYYDNGIVKTIDSSTYSKKGRLIKLDHKFYNNDQRLIYRKISYYHENKKLKKCIVYEQFNEYYVNLDKQSWTYNHATISDYDIKGRLIKIKEITCDYSQNAHEYDIDHTSIITVETLKGKIKPGCKRNECRIFRDDRGWNSIAYVLSKDYQYEMVSYKRFDTLNNLTQETVYSNNDYIDIKYQEGLIISKYDSKEDTEYVYNEQLNNLVQVKQ